MSRDELAVHLIRIYTVEIIRVQSWMLLRRDVRDLTDVEPLAPCRGKHLDTLVDVERHDIGVCARCGAADIVIIQDA